MRSTRPIGSAVASLVLELSREADGQFSLVASIPGRQGTLVNVWPAPVPWDDVQACLLRQSIEFLELTGGVQTVIPW